MSAQRTTLGGLVALIILMLSATVEREARAARTPVPASVQQGEPSIAELEVAAIRAAHLDRAESESWRRRMRVSALAPTVRLGAVKGGATLLANADVDGTTHLTLTGDDTWQFNIAATWSLDKLVWHPDEVRVAREMQRVAARREKLVMEVASLAAERRRLMTGLKLDPPKSAMEEEETHLRIEELTSVLDGLTDGALTLGREKEDASVAAPAGASQVATPEESEPAESQPTVR